MQSILEAIDSRLEAIASRLEALGWRLVLRSGIANVIVPTSGRAEGGSAEQIGVLCNGLIAGT